VADEINPDDLNELEAIFKRAEFEEKATVVTYVEMPYTQAQELCEQAAKYENGTLMEKADAAFTLLAFAFQFCESLGEVLAETANHTSDDTDD
jgi:predicted glycosyltransferase